MRFYYLKFKKKKGEVAFVAQQVKYPTNIHEYESLVPGLAQ